MNNLGNFSIHTLANGATIASLSPHGFKFSDGTESLAQGKAFCDLFTLARCNKRVGEIKGMTINSVQMLLSQHQLDCLSELCGLVSLVLVPFPVLTALREQQVRDRYPNVVAFNATVETQRAAPQDKIVDINNWSY
jgi:hypothetical protein